MILKGNQLISLSFLLNVASRYCILGRFVLSLHSTYKPLATYPPGESCLLYFETKNQLFA